MNKITKSDIEAFTIELLESHDCGYFINKYK